MYHCSHENIDWSVTKKRRQNSKTIVLASPFLKTFFFLMWTIFWKVCIEFVTILLLFYVLVYWPQGMWDLSSSTRDRTLPALEGEVLTTGPPGKSLPFFNMWRILIIMATMLQSGFFFWPINCIHDMHAMFFFHSHGVLQVHHS